MVRKINIMMIAAFLSIAFAMPAAASYLPFNTSAAGNIGVGTSTPQGKFVVVGGNVGIGTWVPVNLFQVGNGATPPLAVTSAGAVTTGGSLTIGNFGNLNIAGGSVIIQGGENLTFAGNGYGLSLSGSGSTYTSPQLDLATNGNIGIGTWIPQAKLGIVGNVGIGTSVGDSYLTTSPPKGGMIVEGNVGIGSLTPGQALDVTGTIRSTGFTLTGNGASSGYVLTSDNNGNANWQAASGGANFWLNNATSNVGINTTQAVGIGTSFVGGTGEATLSVMNGNVGIGTWVPATAFSVGKGSPFEVDSTGSIDKLDGAVAYFNSTELLLQVNGNFTIGNFDNNAGNGTTVMGAYESTVGYLTLESVGNASGASDYINFLTGTQKEAARITTTGNVGIGSWGSNTPNSTLSVVGNIGIGTNQSSAYLQTSAPNGGMIVQGNVGIGTYAPTDVEIEKNVGIGTAFVGGSGEGALTVMNGNVGIGTWVPVQSLYAIGNIYTTGTIGASVAASNGAPYAWLNNATVETNYNGTTIFGNTDGNAGNSTTYIGGGNVTSDLTLQSVYNRTGNGDYIDMKWGNVGVGTEEAIFQSGGIGIGTYNSAYITTTPPAGGLILGGNVGIGTSFSNAGLSVMNGNVGIGTYNPIQTLEVNGIILADVQYNYPAGFGALADNGGNLHVPEALLDQGDSPGISGECLTTTGTQVLWASCTGNVGVGTGYPSSPLNSVQFNNSGVFGGSSNFVFNGTNVGIGTVLSKNTLDIASTVSIGTLYAGYQTAPVNGLIVQGTVGFGTFAPQKPFSVTGDTYLNGNIGIGTTFVGGSGEAGLSVMNGNVGIGTWVPALPLSVTGDSYHNGNIGIGTTLTTTSALAVMNGNVGIGTWITHALLNVNGTIAGTTLTPINSAGVATGIESNASGLFYNATAYDLITIGGLQGNAYPWNIASGSSSSYNGGSINLKVDGTLVETLYKGYVGIGTYNAPANVGIGTVFPGQVFSVVGNIGIGTVANGDNYLTTAPPNGGMLVEGNVGISSVNPQGALDVGGGTICLGHSCQSSWSSIGSNYWLNNGGSNVGINTTQAVGIGTSFVGGTGEATLSVMNGNVGIGTWVPAQALNVIGVITSSGNMIANSFLAPSGEVEVVNIQGGSGANSSLKVQSESGQSGTTDNIKFQLNNATTVGQWQDNSGVYNLGIGTSWPMATLAIVGNVGIGTETYSPFITNAPSGNLVVEGNVGIGSLSPGQKLDVTGTVRTTGFTLTGNGASSGYVLTSDANGNANWQAGGAGSNYWLNNGGSNVGINTTQAVGIGTSFVGGSGEATLSVMNGNVGIGTWIPSAPLQVNGIVEAKLNTLGSVQLSTPGGASGIILFGGINGHRADIRWDDSTSAFSFLTSSSSSSPGNSNGLIIDSSGNVGIGTLTTPDGGSNNTVHWGNVGIGTSKVGGSGEGALSVMNGNVGIGTWVPGALLDLENNSSTLYGFKIGGYNSTVTMGGYNNPVLTLATNSGVGGIRIGGGGTSTNALSVDSNMQVQIDSAGIVGGRFIIVGNNIGIGTNSPTGRLEVEGGNVGIGTWTAPDGGSNNTVHWGNVGIGTSKVGGAGEGALTIMNGNVGIGTWVPAASMQVQGQYFSTEYGNTTGASVTINWNNGNVQYLVLTNNTNTFTLSNPQGGARYMLILKQPSNGSGSGYGAVSWPNTVHWSGNGTTAPTLTLANSAVDIITLIYDSQNNRYYAGYSLDYT